jgi:agmatine deiminase
MLAPREAGFRMPAEWSPHRATWLAWPSHAELWQDNLEGARDAFCRLALAVSEGEFVDVLVMDEDNEKAARASLVSPRIRFHRAAFGDIWLRDTGPLFVRGANGELAAACPSFNGWGGKYVLEHDAGVSRHIAKLAVGPSVFSLPFVLEGGALEVDGEGTVLTTRQCMVHGHRNDHMLQTEIERRLLEAVGASKALWLGQGLQNDHTDGHVDTLARFVLPGVVVAMEPRTTDDPNVASLRAVLRDLRGMFDAAGRSLHVETVPSPGRVVDDEGRPLPASYVNFYVANDCVVVPTYGCVFDDEAVERIGALFPGRRAVAVDSRALLTGGGAIHCITQQQPEEGGEPAPR